MSDPLSPHREELRKALAELYDAAGCPSYQRVSDAAKQVLPPAIRSMNRLGRQRCQEWIVGNRVPQQSEVLLAVVQVLAEHAERNARRLGVRPPRIPPEGYWRDLHRRAAEETRTGRPVSPQENIVDAEVVEDDEPVISSALPDAGDAAGPGKDLVLRWPAIVASRTGPHTPAYSAAPRRRWIRLAGWITGPVAVAAVVAIVLMHDSDPPHAAVQGRLGTHTAEADGASQATPASGSAPGVLSFMVPRAGESVPHDVLVKGNVSVPDGHLLWLTVRSVGSTTQSVTSLEPIMVGPDGAFDDWIGIGRGACDIGKDFEISGVRTPRQNSISAALAATPGKYVHLRELPPEAIRLGEPITVRLSAFGGAPDKCAGTSTRTTP